VRQNVSALEYASKELRGDRKFVMEAVKMKMNGCALRYASEELRGDRWFVMEAVKMKMNGYALFYASEELRGDRKFVMAAVKQNCYAFGYASKELRGDKEVVMEAVRQYGSALQYVSEAMKGDRDVVMAAVKQNGCALFYASKELRGDKEVIMEAVRQNGSALQYASDTQSRKTPLTQEKIDRINQELKNNNLEHILNLIGSTNPSTDAIYHCLDYVIEIFDENNQTTRPSARSNTMSPVQKRNFVKYVMKHEFDLVAFDMECSYVLLGFSDRGDEEIIKKVYEYQYRSEVGMPNQYFPSRHSQVRTLVEAFTGKNLRGKETS